MMFDVLSAIAAGLLVSAFVGGLLVMLAVATVNIGHAMESMLAALVLSVIAGSVTFVWVLL